MYGTEVEVALRRHVGDVGWYPSLVAELVDFRGGDWVVDRGEDHCDIRVVEVGRQEFAVVVGHFAGVDAMPYFVVEAGRR